jgi:hypothetical protein
MGKGVVNEGEGRGCIVRRGLQGNWGMGLSRRGRERGQVKGSMLGHGVVKNGEGEGCRGTRPSWLHV